MELLEPLAEEIVLANPKKLRVIAESTKKTDRLDAQVLAEFLARDMIPRAYMPTPRQRQHRALVRHRQYLRGRMTSVRCKIRHILADYNADRKDLFSARCGKAYFKRGPAQRRRQLRDQAALVGMGGPSGPAPGHDQEDQGLHRQGARPGEAEARAILKTAPGVGFVTAEVVLSELGDVGRFGNAKAVCAYAGLVPDGASRAAARDPRTFADHQARLGAVAVGPGGVGLAAGQDQPGWSALASPG